MAFSASGFIGSVENLIYKNNTTTSSYDISTGLSTRVSDSGFYKGVVGAHELVPVALTMYPVVFVEMKNKQEEFAQLGRENKRYINVFFDIVPVIQYNAGVSYSVTGHELASTELLKITQNIEYLFRAYPKLSQTSQVMECLNEGTEYTGGKTGDTTYNMFSRIGYKARILNT